MRDDTHHLCPASSFDGSLTSAHAATHPFIPHFSTGKIPAYKGDETGMVTPVKKAESKKPAPKKKVTKKPAAVKAAPVKPVSAKAVPAAGKATKKSTPKTKK
jgi:hypothetical protein